MSKNEEVIDTKDKQMAQLERMLVDKEEELVRTNNTVKSLQEQEPWIQMKPQIMGCIESAQNTTNEIVKCWKSDEIQTSTGNCVCAFIYGYMSCACVWVCGYVSCVCIIWVYVTRVHVCHVYVYVYGYMYMYMYMGICCVYVCSYEYICHVSCISVDDDMDTDSPSAGIMCTYI